MSEVTKPADRIILDNLEALKVYFDPMRLKILHQMINEPKSVHEIAEALNVPFTRLYYHINLLEKNNIIHVVETRAMSGAVEEKYYQVAAYQFIVPRSMLSFSTPEGEESINVFLSAMLDETTEDIRQNIRSGHINMELESPEPDSLLLRRGLMKMSREKVSQFHQDLMDLMRRYQDEPSTPEDAYYGLLLAVYPTALETDSADEAQEE
jgi:DNA-binding transcriptional ArsR family regulator